MARRAGDLCPCPHAPSRATLKVGTREAKEVRAMMLTWRDAVTTLLAGAIIAVYLAFLDGTHLWLISGARGTAVTVLLLGLAGGYVLGTARHLATAADSAAVRVYLAVAALLGAAALAAAVIGVITGSTAALAALVVVMILLWLASIVRHAFTLPAYRRVGRAIRPADQRRLAHR